METLLSVEEAARRLGGLSKYTIHAWLSSGKLRRTKVGSRTMIRQSDLQAFVDGCNPAPHEGNLRPRRVRPEVPEVR
jgi:excisionase family DNA binding protein